MGAATLEVKDLSLRFGGLQALDKISFDATSGELLALIGPNGAGKTTVFNCINGLYRPDEGSIRVDGEELVGRKPHRIARTGVARTFQNIELFANMSTLDNLMLGRHIHLRSGFIGGMLMNPRVTREEMAHRRRVEEILDLLDLQAARDHPVSGLPYGIQKMVELGRALALEPRLLLLDEPCAGMNAEETLDLAFRIADIRAELDVTILLVEHDMRLVMDISDRVLAMSNGRVITCGAPAEVRDHPEVLRAIIGDTDLSPAPTLDPEPPLEAK
jgi:branched-chain amino acid transport system ATP-binding protein